MAYLPAPFQPTWYPQVPQPVSAAPPPQQGLIWVDGEAAAKAYQMPAGWPANTPIALWDTNDTIIYLKSTNSMGMPNPLQIAEYQLRELRSARSGAAGREDYTEQTWDEERQNKFASKQELQELKDMIMEMKGEKK